MLIITFSENPALLDLSLDLSMNNLKIYNKIYDEGERASLKLNIKKKPKIISSGPNKDREENLL